MRTAVRLLLPLQVWTFAALLGSGAAPRAAAQAGRAASSPTPGALQIVVLAGEDAVNVVQQKTAVAPVVEVRDRNGHPVAGAVVRFAIRGGRASFGGSVRTISVTTDLAGKAAASGFTPTSAGLVQVNVTASFQGQTVIASISQINVATAAQAAAATGAGAAGAGGGAAGAGGAGATAGAAGAAGAAAGAAAAGAETATAGAAAGAGAAGVGGGLSAVTVAAVGGAVGGGVIAATKVLGADAAHYSGNWSGQLSITWTNRNPALPPSPCTITLAWSGTMTIELNADASGKVEGEANGTETWAPVANTCGGPYGSYNGPWGGETVSGTTTAITTREDVSTSGTNSDGPWTQNDVKAFSGALANGVITGTYGWTLNQYTSTREGHGAVVLPITLQ